VPWSDRDVQTCIGNDVYTTADHVRFAVLDPRGGVGQMIVEIAPGETKTVTVNGKPVTIHRPLSTSTPELTPPD
jgi:hypothetical protein